MYVCMFINYMNLHYSSGYDETLVNYRRHARIGFCISFAHVNSLRNLSLHTTNLFLYHSSDHDEILVSSCGHFRFMYSFFTETGKL